MWYATLLNTSSSLDRLRLLFNHNKFRTKQVGGAKNELYDIGAKILFVPCFVTTDMFLFFTKYFSGNCRICRDLAFGSVKTRFKAILKKSDFRHEFACGQLSWPFSNQNKL